MHTLQHHLQLICHDQPWSMAVHCWPTLQQFDCSLLWVQHDNVLVKGSNVCDVSCKVRGSAWTFWRVWLFSTIYFSPWCEYLSHFVVLGHREKAPNHWPTRWARWEWNFIAPPSLLKSCKIKYDCCNHNIVADGQWHRWGLWAGRGGFKPKDPNRGRVYTLDLVPHSIYLSISILHPAEVFPGMGKAEWLYP